MFKRMIENEFLIGSLAGACQVGVVTYVGSGLGPVAGLLAGAMFYLLSELAYRIYVRKV